MEERIDTPNNDHVSVTSEDTDSVNAARESSEPGAQSTNMRRGFSKQRSLVRTTTASTTDFGNRRIVASVMNAVSSFADPAPDRFNYQSFQHGIAASYPPVPGEAGRNPKLGQITELFNNSRDVDGSVTPIRPSRAASFTGSAASIRQPSPSPSHSPRDASFPLERTSSELHAPPPAVTRGRRPRGNTLEVPIAHHGLQTNSSFVEAMPDTPSSPTIVISEMSENGK